MAAVTSMTDSVRLAAKKPRSRRPNWFMIATLVPLVLGAIVMIFPFIWMLTTSLKPESAVVTYPPTIWPKKFSIASYVNIWPSIGFLRLFMNSAIYAVAVTLLSLLFDSLMAFALARLDFPGRNILFWIVIGTLMVPFQVLIVPIYVTVFHFGWLNTYQGLIIPRAASGFGMFLLRQFFVGIPRELDEAARLDGASSFGLYWRVILPLSVPALVALGIFQFTYNWNDFLWPLIITSTNSMHTIPAGLALFTGEHEVQYSLVMAGAVLTMLPLAIGFTFLQRYFIRGIALTGMR